LALLSSITLGRGLTRWSPSRRRWSPSTRSPRC